LSGNKLSTGSAAKSRKFRSALTPNGDYLAWPEDVRYELIDGIACAMSPAPTVSYQEVLLERSRQIDEAMDESACRVLIAPLDVHLPRGDEADAAVEAVVQPPVCQEFRNPGPRWSGVRNRGRHRGVPQSINRIPNLPILWVSPKTAERRNGRTDPRC